jgi:cell wall-associated NlpC family hydrolase
MVTPITMTVIFRSRRLAIGALALAAASAACASSGAVPRPFPMPGGDPSPVVTPEGGAPASRSRTAPVDVYALTGTALALRGIPYRNGGTDPQGFDCSGFTQYVFGQHGVALPRDVREQYRVGKPVDPQDLEPGDMVFFSTTDPGPSHVAIALGGDEFVHAPSTSGVVRVEHLSSSYWSPRFLGARRLN